MKNLLKLAVLALGMAALPAAHATDGVIEINQAKITAGGGFPFSISQPGSYRLTGNLTVPDANTTAILVSTDNVSIDLNGFQIKGPTVCSNIPVTACAPTGTGDGIRSNLLTQGLTVLNGAIVGMGRDGIRVADSLPITIPPTAYPFNGARIENVSAISNGHEGINAGNRTSHVKNCIARTNGDNGIYLGYGSATQNTVVGNQNYGILVYDHGLIQDNNIFSNGMEGLWNWTGISVYRGNSVTGNNGGGAQVTPGTLFNGGGNLCGNIACP